MSLGDRLREAFLAEGADRVRWPRQRFAVVERHASPEVLAAAGLWPGVQLGRSFSNSQLYGVFHAVARDRDPSENSDTEGRRRHTFPAHVCNEAEEILHALGLLETPRLPRTRARTDDQAAFGRVCSYCWRTEAKPRKMGLYGRCHIHVELPPPSPGESETDEQREARLTARSEADKARRLLAAAPPGTLEDSNYPVLPRRPLVPNLSEINWREFVENHFPLVAAFALGKSEDALATFTDTVAALEGRPLTQNEARKLADPFWALPPLLRCEAWLNLREMLFRKRGKGR